MKKYAAEFIGTFALIFCGTGAIIINQVYPGSVGNTGISLTFGLIVSVMIYTFGSISGAHFNPAVTLGFASLKLFPAREVMPYILAQIAGALAASFLLKFLFPLNAGLGSTHPAAGQIQSAIFEFLLTFFLMLTILFISQGSDKTKPLAGLIIGAVILLEAQFAGPVCGASMNPVRSLAPAIASANFQDLWIYLISPIFGSLSASLVFKGFAA